MYVVGSKVGYSGAGATLSMLTASSRACPAPVTPHYLAIPSAAGALRTGGVDGGMRSSHHQAARPTPPSSQQQLQPSPTKSAAAATQRLQEQLIRAVEKNRTDVRVIHSNISRL